MTLVVAVTRKDSIWLLADRRLSYVGRPPKDDARKIAFLETIDGVAILGYAGLGATALGTEPSDWINAVLRGRNLTLEHSLGVLANAIQQEMPRHLIRFPGKNAPTHTFVVPAFVDEEARLYTIDLVFSPDRRTHQHSYVRHAIKSVGGSFPPPGIAWAGSGSPYVQADKNQQRLLVRVASAHDRRLVTSYTVADQFAALNDKIHNVIPDRSVGQRCIVAWRYRKNGVHGGGGGHQFYTGRKRDDSTTSLPTIAQGMNVSGLIESIMPSFEQMMEAFNGGQPSPEIDKDEMNALAAKVPNKPDESLR